MKLNVIIPTYNRAKLLAQTLQSVENAHIPANLEVEIIVVNNNSDDETEQVVKDLQTNFKFKLKYLFEKVQGRSSAVNTGIRHSDSDLVAMIDDDIQIEADWFLQIEKIFTERWEEVDFIGGKVLPIWEIEPPDWVTIIKDVGICWRDYGEVEWPYGPDTPILTGGHAVLKTKVFQDVSLYSTELGPKGKNLIGCEDEVMFDELIEKGKKGIYLPGLIVHHFVPAYRLKKSYFRQWHWGAGMSWNLMEIHYKSYQGAKILRVPRYLYRNALKGLFKKIKALVAFNKYESLKAEKDILIFLGFFYSRNILETRLNNPLQKLAKRTIRVAER